MQDLQTAGKGTPAETAGGVMQVVNHIDNGAMVLLGVLIGLIYFVFIQPRIENRKQRKSLKAWQRQQDALKKASGQP